MTRALAPVRGARQIQSATAAAVTLLLVIAQTAAGVTWHDEVEADAYVTSTRVKSLAVTGTQRVHLFYARHRDDIPGTKAVYRRSGDGGLTWKDPMTLSPDNQTGVRALAIKRFGQATLDVLWMNDVGGGAKELWYRRSLNNGFAWGDPMNVAPGQLVINGDVARFGDRVSIVYTNALTQSIDVRISTDGGQTFGDPVLVGYTDDFTVLAPSGGHPTIIDKNGTITVAWFTHYLLAEMELVVRRSTNAGATWRPVQVLKGIYSGVRNGPISLLGAGPLKIIIGYLVDEGGHARAAARTSLNAGKTWRPEVLVGGAQSRAPTFAYAGGLLRAAYFTCIGEDCPTVDIKFKTSEDFGTTWSPSSIVNPEPVAYGAPAGIGPVGNGQSVVAYVGYNPDTFITYLFTRTTLE